MKSQLFLWLVIVIVSGFYQQCLAWPEKLAPVQNVTGSCGSTDTSIREGDIHVLIRDIINPYINSKFGPVCGCGGQGWTKMADLDMSDSSQSCPTSNWRLVDTASVRGCGQGLSGRCHSAIFPSRGVTYSQVCGQINAIQFGHPDAFGSIFDNSKTGLEGSYVDGVSITHGSPGSRKHIWTFAAAIGEVGLPAITICACTNVDQAWPYTLPSWIGKNYFCETANPGPTFSTQYYLGDALWDGKGCGARSACCGTNNPPFFCASLPAATNDDLEVRICSNEGVAVEDTVITKMELYVK